MAQKTAFSWVPFYKKLADALLKFKNNRSQLIADLFAAFQERGLNIPKWSEDAHPRDVDPFTVMGCFNRQKPGENRVAYAQAVSSVLGVAWSEAPDFDGVPIVNAQKSAFYGWEAQRDKDSCDISNLWHLFETALRLADAPSDEHETAFAEWFDKVEQQPYVRWNLTMGLFWIRPDTFVNLDTLNRSFLTQYGQFTDVIGDPDKVPDGRTYWAFCCACRLWVQSATAPVRSIPAISHEAYLRWMNKEKNLSPDTEETTRYWVLACKDSDGVEYWDDCFQHGKAILGYGLIGDIRDFADKNAVREALNTIYEENFNAQAHWPGWLWKFAHEIKPGDMIYAKSGTRTVRGIGKVTEGYRYTRTPLVAGFNHELCVEWQNTNAYTAPSEIFARMQALQEIKGDKFKEVSVTYPALQPEHQEPHLPSLPAAEPYTKADFLNEVFVDETLYDRMTASLEYKSNIILQGAPGVGKTFLAQRLAYACMGCKDTTRVQLVQFHHSYSYEEFMEGYRPNATGGFTLQRGTFYDFCQKAKKDTANTYFYIIDEINRGNLNKIFGETFLLLEKDKRGLEAQLLYSKEMFCVPPNVFIIGMMNTADRSIALMDHALRRRFAFIDIPPAFSHPSFRRHIQAAPAAALPALLTVINSLNAEIACDISLGKGYRIGHSYFCPASIAELTDARLRDITEFELIPLLEEYWCEEAQKVSEWAEKLRAAVTLS